MKYTILYTGARHTDIISYITCQLSARPIMDCLALWGEHHLLYSVNVVALYSACGKLVECLALWGERAPPVILSPINVVAVYSACDKITVVVLEEACLIAKMVSYIFA